MNADLFSVRLQRRQTGEGDASQVTLLGLPIFLSEAGQRKWLTSGKITFAFPPSCVIFKMFVVFILAIIATVFFSLPSLSSSLVLPP